MEKIAIVYVSYHHKNTKKVLDEMAKYRNLELVKVSDGKEKDWSEYTHIGFASGIYFGGLDKALVELADKLPITESQKTFIVYTCGSNFKNYAKKLEEILKSKKGAFAGTFWCKGYDTYGFLKYIGGIAKRHPNEDDLRKAAEFIKGI